MMTETSDWLVTLNQQEYCDLHRLPLKRFGLAGLHPLTTNNIPEERHDLNKTNKTHKKRTIIL